jgi:hypothetical protein
LEKALGPAEKQELVDYAHESHKLSLRQACILFSICFGVYTFKSKPKEDSELHDALAELATVHT